MAGIRCPMCGKLNPEELEACQYCEARLKPLRLDSQQDQYSTGDQAGDSAAPESHSDSVDWLRSLRQDESTLRAEDEGSDWSDDMTGQLEETSEEDRLDWLADMRSGTEGLLGEEEENEGEWEDAAPSEDLPDWLASIRGAAQQEDEDITGEDAFPSSEEAGELPDWLSGTGEGSPEAEVEQEPDIPGWLAGVNSETESEDEVPQDLESGLEKDMDWADQVLAGEEKDQEADAGLPDWLSQSQQEDASEEHPDWLEETGEGEQDAAPAEDVPDWLRSLHGEESEETETPGYFQEDAASASDLPDWLANTQPGASAEEDEGQGGSDEAAWMERLDREPESSSPVEGFETGSLNDFDLTAEEPEENLDWLDNFEAGQPAEGAEPEREDESGPGTVDFDEEGETAFPAEDLPGWLMEPQPEGQDKESLPFAEHGEAETAGETSSRDSDLAPAELPSWLQAMRPMDLSSGSEGPVEPEDTTVEDAGPLAGLRSVLPTEMEASRIGTPPPYTTKLSVTKGQQEHSRILEALIQSEGTARVLPSEPAISPQHVLRVAIGVILFGAILLALLAGAPLVSKPAPIGEPLFANQLIGTLSGGQPVLVAFDYDPGFSGEMDAAAEAVLEHMMLRGTYLGIVSTTPTGPIQAERVISDLNVRFQHNYQPGSQYVNLGYIPGGPAGLLLFALQPDLATPRDLNTGDSVWEEPGPFAGLQGSLANFALVTVITDRPEVARAWIEQVEPATGNAPLLMVVSAQAEPIVRPYYQAPQGQVDGLVSGLSGAVAYEEVNGRPGLGSSYWSAFSLGGFAAVLLMVVGGIFNAILALMGHQKAQRTAVKKG